MNISFTQGFSPAQAERGKFAPIDLSTLSPAYSGDGRYAILTYNIGAAATTPSVSGTPVPTNNTLINMSQTIAAGAMSAVNFGVTVNYIEVYNNDQRDGLPLTYVSLSNPTTFATLTAIGMILNKSSYYNVSFETPTIWVGASGTGDVNLRIMGHRAVQ